MAKKRSQPAEAPAFPKNPRRGPKRAKAKATEPTCAYGNPSDERGKMPGYDGPHHCPDCAASIAAVEVEMGWPASAAAEPETPESETPEAGLLPAAEAIAEVAEQLGTNGNGTPEQAALFDIAKPFNFEGAWLEER